MRDSAKILLSFSDLSPGLPRGFGGYGATRITSQRRFLSVGVARLPTVHMADTDPSTTEPQPEPVEDTGAPAEGEEPPAEESAPQGQSEEDGSGSKRKTTTKIVEVSDGLTQDDLHLLKLGSELPTKISWFTLA